MDISLIRGDTWLRSWKLKNGTEPIDLTGASVRVMVRDPDNNFAVLLEASTINGKITLVPLSGEIIMRVEATETKALEINKFKFDCEVTFADGVVRTIEQGTLKVGQDYTYEP